MNDQPYKIYTPELISFYKDDSKYRRQFGTYTKIEKALDITRIEKEFDLDKRGNNNIPVKIEVKIYESELDLYDFTLGCSELMALVYNSVLNVSSREENILFDYYKLKT